MRARRSAVLRVLCVLLFLAGCSDDSATPTEQVSGQGEIDPCTLVTADEAGQVLATQVAAERPNEANNDFLATCRYVGPRGQSVAVLVVSVSRMSGSVAFDNAKRMTETGIELQTVQGVGDDAVWAEMLNTLYVLESGVYLTIGGDIQLDQARPLAAQAVERLS